MIKKTFAAIALLSSWGVFAQAQQAPGTVLAASGGRYVFGQISSGRVDQYMLDTQTGRVWQMQCVKKSTDGFGCDSALFVPVPFQWPAGSPDGYGLTPVWIPPAASPPPIKK